MVIFGTTSIEPNSPFEPPGAAAAEYADVTRGRSAGGLATEWHHVKTTTALASGVMMLIKTNVVKDDQFGTD